MKRAVILFCIAVATSLTACTNHNAVNVIVVNKQQQTLQKVPVAISVKDICSNLGVERIERPIILNEKNLCVPYIYNKNRDSLLFEIPMIHKGSQKTYSINLKMPTLSDGLLRAKRNNIRIEK